jgi:ElaB/YqjD/DUF883 family membrane-anchored ribosome-binding protein
MSTTLDTERLLTDMRAVVRDAEQLLAATPEALGEKAHEIRDRLARTLENAKEGCRRLEDKAVDAAKSADKVIRDHPYQAVGVALGVGLLVGMLVAKRD